MRLGMPDQRLPTDSHASVRNSMLLKSKRILAWGFWIGFTGGCGGGDPSAPVMVESAHSHYHVHGIDASHEHSHDDATLGGHEHSHEHAE